MTRREWHEKAPFHARIRFFRDCGRKGAFCVSDSITYASVLRAWICLTGSSEISAISSTGYPFANILRAVSILRSKRPSDFPSALAFFFAKAIWLRMSRSVVISNSYLTLSSGVKVAISTFFKQLNSRRSVRLPGLVLPSVPCPTQ